jgi:hypothetical protein
LFVTVLSLGDSIVTKTDMGPALKELGNEKGRQLSRH